MSVKDKFSFMRKVFMKTDKEKMLMRVNMTKKSLRQERLHDFLKNPTRVIVVSFALIISVGTLLLMLPFSSREGIFTSFPTAFFTATSATCVTGLIVEDTYTYFSTFGQVVILLLIQFGGLGLVTITTFFNIAIRRKIGLKTAQLAQESINSDGSQDIRVLIKMIILLTFGIELVGAIVLSGVFIPEFGADGIFISVFLAISAYCNAGFDILGRIAPYTSLTTYSDNPVVLITIMLLIIFGGLGFIVWYDLCLYRRHGRLILHTKIVLLATGILIIFGTVCFLALEWNNPFTIGKMPVWEKILNGIFHSVSCRTAGFNTVDLVNMGSGTKLMSCFLMFIGAAPGSTGGGIKVTTFIVLAVTVTSVMRGRDDTIIMGRKIVKQVVYKALAVTVIALIAVLIATFVISYTVHENGTMIGEIDALFESTSAFATVGLSVGVTGVANLTSRMILALTMFLGRVGPVALALTLLARSNPDKHQIIPEGRIIVG